MEDIKDVRAVLILILANKRKKPRKTPLQNNMARLNAEFAELSRGIYFLKVRHPVLFSYN
jgi:hypothetical protein